MKVLYVTTISSTMGFFAEHIRMLQNKGYAVELACNLAKPLSEKIAMLGCQTYDIPFSRSPIKRTNFMAYKKIKELIKSSDYDIVHTHTPVASAITRLACRKQREKGLKVIYTAHGFHFYKGAPLKNWLLYYPMEWICAHFTDVLITINCEDYDLAKRRMKAKRRAYVPGVGINVKEFSQNCVDRKNKRQELGVADDAIVILSVGELNENKNHRAIISALAQMNDQNIYYLIAGKGSQKVFLETQIKESKLENRVKLLGYRTDVDELYKVADIYCLPSFREGLNVSVMEAMASGLPCVVSDIRGNHDLILNEDGGYLCLPNDSATYAEAFTKLVQNKGLRDRFGCKNQERACKYDSSSINKKMMEIYLGYMKG